MTGRTPPPAPTPSAIVSRVSLNERVLTEEESPIFGPLTLRELTRRQWREASRASQAPDDPGKIIIETWNCNVFAAGVIDSESGKPAYTSADAVLDLPMREGVWEEILRLGTLILELSEVGQEALKSEDPQPDAG